MNSNATRTTVRQPASETITAKGMRYLAEGRLRVTRIDGTRVRATCRGNDAVYDLGHDGYRGWHCTCPARVYICCHISALQTVTALPLPAMARCVSCGHQPGCDCPEECITAEQELALFARANGS